LAIIYGMKAPLSWLKKYIALSKSPTEIADKLTSVGLEVDKIDRFEFDFSNVIVGKIVEILAHPNADQLRIIIIFDGKEKHQVVCGDLTLPKDAHVPFAPIGAILQSASQNPLTIKKAKLRGIESNGMLCSEKELSLSNTSQGVMTLPSDSPIGEDLASYLRDPIFDISLTPNLGYCRSIVGIARELSAYFDDPFEMPTFQLKEDPDNLTNAKIQLVNIDSNNTHQYMCRVIQGIEVGPSPLWLQDFLKKAGYQSINNVVDITNFVMHELGQPLHAFDYDKITQKQIQVRPAQLNEQIVTLDGMERKIPEGSTVICDGEKPIAIGGVMGGEESSITDSTYTVLLESAQFDSSNIRKTSRLLGLRTESSARFENEIDPNTVRIALDRAADLLQTLAGGRVLKGVVEQSPKPYRPRFLTCRLSKINGLLGTNLSLSEVEFYLTKLQIATTSDDVNVYQLKVPSWRNDIQSEIDIVEEVARMYGFENISQTPPKHINSQIPHHPIYLLEKETRSRLVAKGLQEFITCDLISPTQCDLEIENGLFKSEYVQVLHAKSIDQSILRPSLLPGLLQVICHNQNQGYFDIKGFEIGRVHLKEESGFEEKTTLGIVLVGKKEPYHFETKPKDVDFFDLKGIIENLSKALHLPKLVFENSSFKTFHPSRQAAIKVPDGTIGVMGEVHPISLRKLDIRKRVYFAEIDLHEVQLHKGKTIQFNPLPQFPASHRDFTFTMKKNKSMDDVFKIVNSLSSPLIKERELIDIYTDEKIGKEKKNITFRFTYRDDKKTLDLQTIEKEHEKVIKTLKKVSS